jgi:chromate transporter
LRAGADLLRGDVKWPYLVAGAVAAAVTGPYVVLVLLACGALETGRRAFAFLTPIGGGGLAWVALKVGALSYGGGFVIIPLMQSDTVDRYHWMTDEQFLSAVALGQVTPGPVTHTVAAVGYAAAGVGGALFAAAIAFAPSFVFILGGAPRFERLRANPTVRAFLDGAGPAAIGAIIGSAVPLALALGEGWQYAVLAVAAVALLVFRAGIVVTLVAAGAVGAVVG